MSDKPAENPLDPSPETDERIRTRAYFLWQQEGEPVGQEAAFWERARELEALHMPVGLEPNPMIANPDGPPAADVIEEASIQENLGEFPDRSADQGEVQVTPMTRTAARKARAPKK